MTRLKMKTVMKLLNFWPPYLGAGIKIVNFTTPLNDIQIEMPLLARNRNYVGTHFGGNLYSMCDPWYMFILLNHLGDEHVVWDQSASIDFIKPGRGTVSATFSIPISDLTQITEEAKLGAPIRPTFETYIKDQNGVEIALVKKELYVRRKPK